MKKLRSLLMFVLVFSVCTFMIVSCGEKSQPENKQDAAVNQGGEIGTEDFKETVVLKLYFPDNEALYLHAEEREVELSADDSREMAVLNELFYGPESDELSSSLSGEDLVNSVYTDESGLCTVDFKQDFVTLNTGGTARETFVIGSVVHSLCELDGIERVKINIDGNEKAEFGHSILEYEFTANDELVKE